MFFFLFCFLFFFFSLLFFFQAEDGIRDLVRSRGLGDVYKRQAEGSPVSQFAFLQGEWAAVFESAARAETAVHADPRTACFLSLIHI